MKNLRFVFILLSSFIFSCQEENAKDEEVLISESFITYSIDEVMSYADQGDAVFISPSPYPEFEEDVFWVYDGWEYGWVESELASARITQRKKTVCKGSGISFGRCVKKYVDKGGCVIISKNGSTYTATATNCPRLYGYIDQACLRRRRERSLGNILMTCLDHRALNLKNNQRKPNKPSPSSSDLLKFKIRPSAFKYPTSFRK